MYKQKRVAAIHDISGFGKCSLTVALPILSAIGIETSVIPTAVLSTHTGGFTGFTYRDLTEDMLPMARHWHDLGLEFDAIYTGYLGSIQQIDIVHEIISLLRGPSTLVLMDPAMADNGKLYSLFTSGFAAEMARLCADAELITPNITEACLMLGIPYRAGPYTPDFIRQLVKGLCAMGPEKVVLTGVTYDDKTLGAASYDAASGQMHEYLLERIPGMYHGTGDVYASALLAALLKGILLQDAMALAVDFTCGSIQRTYEAQTDVRFGVNFEEGLPAFYDAIEVKKGEC